uniref:SPT6_acidic domain-containing protein n=1 Tax=Ascaris lumbricoides TaxID=6252 RepID=A0A0M3I5B1_ASCLU
MSVSIPCIDAPHAPLADAVELDELSFDIPFSNEISTCNTALNAADEPDDDGSDEEMGEEDEEDADFDFKEDELSEDDERHKDEDEYPELSRDNGEAVVEGDSYDFAVMDTEKDTTEGTRKRKV